MYVLYDNSETSVMNEASIELMDAVMRAHNIFSNCKIHYALAPTPTPSFSPPSSWRRRGREGGREVLN